MQSDYKVGFWNYVDTGVRDENDVAMWKDLGFNLAMSYEFDVKRHDKAQMRKVLDECKRQGLCVIVCDKRTDYRGIFEKGKERFAQELREAIADFGGHEAVYGFHIGDEPGEDKNSIEAAAYAISVFKAAAPQLKAYLNFLPISDSIPCTPSQYCDNWYRGMKDSGMDIVSFDYYGQCCYFDKEFFKDIYFQNLKEYKALAEKMGAEAWTCLLTVGHGSLRVPTQDDIRWQLNTAAAHGFTGFLWFFLYERFYDAWWGFRNAPIDRYWNKTDTYYKLLYENRTFLEYVVPVLSKYKFVRARHYNHCYGGFEKFVPDGGIKDLNIWINETAPLIVSEFENEEAVAYVIVNNSQTEPVRIRVDFADFVGREQASPWLVPGGIQIFEIQKKEGNFNS